MKGKGLHMLTFTLMGIGALNWLLYALFGWEIGSIFGGMQATFSKVIYVAVGLAAIYEFATHKNNCKLCGTSGGQMMK